MREIISKVYDFIKKEANNFAEKIADARWRTAQAVGVSKRTVTRILSERKVNLTKQNSLNKASNSAEVTDVENIVDVMESISNLEGTSAAIFTPPKKKRKKL